MKGIEKFVEKLKNHKWLQYYYRQSPKKACFSPVPENLHSGLKNALTKNNIEQLYSHQSFAFNSVKQGKNIVVVTPTASGKTLCYNLPVIDEIANNRNTKAIYLFPTKALARDQLKGILALSEQSEIPVKCEVYDGDTPGDTREGIRKNASIIISNPDMIHQAILPHHPKWKRVLENLKYIVIDEMHIYTGVFGSHFANVIRRLKRICNFYGANPQFICCSATIANPVELAQNLCGVKFQLIDNNGAPSSGKHFFFVNPPIVNKELVIRKSYLDTSTIFAREFINLGIPTISFARTRMAVEVMTKYLKDKASVTKKNKIAGYRGGYLPKERRAIEKAIKDRKITFIVSTNALELGIDIGELQGCIISGYPGTIASTLQQAGRAGRKSDDAIIILIASNMAVDQFIVQNPEYLFKGSPEHGRVNPDNVEILFNHLACASFELPFKEGEIYGNFELQEAMEQLSDMELVNKFGDKWHWIGESYPAATFSLRSVTNDNFVVIDLNDKNNKVIAEVDFYAAHTTLYEQAIYMLQGKLYQVEKLDYANRKAFVKQVNSEYYTDAIDHTHLNILSNTETQSGFLYSFSKGEVHVLTRVTGYKKIKFYTFENIGYGTVEIPDIEMHTTSFWITISDKLREQLQVSKSDFTESLSGLLYAVKNISSVFLMCDVRDLGSTVQVDDTQDWSEFSLFIYDKYPGGVGLSNECYNIRQEVFLAVKELIKQCKCEEGCPSCVGIRNAETGNIKNNVLSILPLLLQ
jgi:DEAD/DEAH box helicase domain-containing protein